MSEVNAFGGKVAVITGAGSGIGRALAYDLARDGARLAVSDIDETGLAETVRQLRVIGAQVHSTRLDTTDRPAMLRYADEVAAEFGVVNYVFNNAGVAFTGDIEDMSFEQMERVVDIDFWGVVNGTKAFLPHLIASGDGHVVNISSVFGLLAIPGQSAYNAAKFANRGFTEALRMEMLVAGHPVAVSCVHPGGIKTAIARNAQAVAGHDAAQLAEYFDRKLAKTSPETAAKVILRGVKRKKARILVGPDAYFLEGLTRVSGAGYERLVAWFSSKQVPQRTTAAAPPVSGDLATGETPAKASA